QKRNSLAQDGKVGPVTLSVLMDGNYKFGIQRPPRILEPEWTCWAASFQSALESTWSGGRPHLTVADFVDRYRRFLAPRKDITVPGFHQVVRDLGAISVTVAANDFTIEPILAELGRNGQQVLMVHDLTGSVAHTVVIWGVVIREGQPSFLIMDPLIGD